jgi:hypothetical protein
MLQMGSLCFARSLAGTSLEACPGGEVGFTDLNFCAQYQSPPASRLILH